MKAIATKPRRWPSACCIRARRWCGKDYDFEAGMFIDDGRFDPQAVAALKQSFVDMGTLAR